MSGESMSTRALAADMSPLRGCWALLLLVLCEWSVTYAMYDLELIPERVEVLEVNPLYCRNLTLTVRRAGRRGRYVVNAAGYNMQPWNNNVTVHLQFFEYLHNEYRPSFVEASYRLCDFVNKNQFGGNLRQYGVVCPMAQKYWALNNASLVVPQFPYKFPFSRCKLAITVRTSAARDTIGKVDLFVHIKTTQNSA